MARNLTNLALVPHNPRKGVSHRPCSLLTSKIATFSSSTSPYRHTGVLMYFALPVLYLELPGPPSATLSYRYEYNLFRVPRVIKRCGVIRKGFHWFIAWEKYGMVTNRLCFGLYEYFGPWDVRHEARRSDGR